MIAASSRKSLSFIVSSCKEADSYILGLYIFMYCIALKLINDFVSNDILNEVFLCFPPNIIYHLYRSSQNWTVI